MNVYINKGEKELVSRGGDEIKMIIFRSADGSIDYWKYKEGKNNRGKRTKI